MLTYKWTTIACYIGNLAGALITNLTPILFIPLRTQFGLSLEQLGLLIFINFTTQVAIDLLFSRIVDKHGFRPFIVTAQILTVIGFFTFALSPLVFPQPYMGFVIGTIIFSGAGGLHELLLSPIVNAIPTDDKEKAMSILHSFYAWGVIIVVLVTSSLMSIFGTHIWPLIMMGWAIVPFFNFFLFLYVPLGKPFAQETHMELKELFQQRFFWVAILLIIAGGSSEVSIAQWASAFLERGLGIPKIWGDIFGVCMFSFMLGLGRAIYGHYGKRIYIEKVMQWGALGAFICYIIMVFAQNNLLSISACMFTGFAVSLLWPGTLVIASKRFPQAGASMFAILAAGGDIGCSVVPWMVGFVAESTGINAEQYGLRLGILIASFLPIIAFCCLIWIRKHKDQREGK
jgi:fucose permease